ncbi:MAG: tRNA 2-thiouridine(34) synthase MnmA [Bacilli bacterium]|nr:tRNA 2-thiouridine(34) synthase MnmA [Bacilli bacterium]MDD3422011.1 tRNA 2-thiouridine(34) synthase MnmA [Bacilli bacterium]MDD4065396.1 tRNA 2-thiouridine(34) synthase MnmA [Bacilli bacterium]
MAKIMIGLSGGVDSAVAAYLLKSQGHEVIAGFMRNWDSLANNDILGNNNVGPVCPQEQDYQDAKAVADKLGIPLYRVDFIKEYWDNVFSYFVQEYQKGRTPNPDVLCNKYIKFDAFLKFAMEHNVDYIATGHYAKVSHEDGKNVLYKAKDLNKDQSYFLALLTSEQLSKTWFPLSDITKPEVREIAHKLGLSSVESKKDSTGICFIGERDFRKFLQNYIPAQPGDIVDYKSGQVIGHHIGVMYYTLGQRRGLGIGGIKDHESGSWFVFKKDIDKRILYVAQGDDAVLYDSEVIVKDVNWINGPKPLVPTKMCAKFRYRQKDCEIEAYFMDETTVKVHCLNKVKAITPGQICVFYQGDICLGGGTIDSSK